jgi:DNA-binding NtrC family response regulator
MVELNVPALRERPQDIPEFIRFFSERFALRYQRPVWQPTPDELRAFCEYHWPGNIRQLSHVIEQSYVLDSQPALPHLRPDACAQSSLPFFNLERLRRAAVRQALSATKGHKGRAARLLGVHANTLTRILAHLAPDKPTGPDQKKSER